MNDGFGISGRPAKDVENQQVIAPAWRVDISAIVSAIASGDLVLASTGPNVKRLSKPEAEQIRRNISDYGDVTIAEAPDETWESSAAMWTGTYWEAVVDLWDVNEGRTDLVVNLVIRECGQSYDYEVCGVWVP
jgi:hypothetical protein